LFFCLLLCSYPAAHFPFALLYFTGSDHFNRSMRFYSRQRRWTLSDHGLCPALRVGREKVWSGRSVYCQTERDIFDALGLLYVPPEQRNVYQHFDQTEEELRVERSLRAHLHGGGSAAGSADAFSLGAHAAAAGSSATAAAAGGSTQADDEDDASLAPNEGVHPALRPAPQSATAAAAAAAAGVAAAASSANSSQAPLLLPSGRPLKTEVGAELSEVEQVLRAQKQLQRIAEEEEEIVHNRLRGVAAAAGGKQMGPPAGKSL
jgi:hypothetical protein